MIKKIERINQLKEWGYNTPKILQIDYGNKYDKTLETRLKKFAGSAKKMTIRTYSPTDEIGEFKTDFFPEIPTNEAIKKVKNLVTKYYILFQEAIDVNTTAITGNILLKRDGTGLYEILKGHYRVRDIDNTPPGAVLVSKQFESFININDMQMKRIVYEVKDIINLVPYSGGVIIEFDLHNEPVGEKKEDLILWEYREYGSVYFY